MWYFDHTATSDISIRFISAIWIGFNKKYVLKLLKLDYMKKKKSKLLFRRNPNYCSFVIKCDIIFIRYAMNSIFSAKLCSSIHILKGLRSNKQHRMTCFQVYLREELIPLSHGFSQRDNTLFARQRHLAISQLS